MLRLIVAIIPLVGAIIFPFAVPFAMAHLGLPIGISLALVLSTLWFAFMLRTSEMPH